MFGATGVGLLVNSDTEVIDVEDLSLHYTLRLAWDPTSEQNGAKKPFLALPQQKALLKC